MDIVRCIREFNTGRDPERLARKFRNMRSSPFVFMRGTCHLFYEGLPRDRALEQAPFTWVCGDLHIENFGSFKGDNRLVYFDMNDFDEAALAPCTWELARLLASILVALQGMRIERADAIELCLQCIGAYATALADGKARWVERETAHGLVKQLLNTLRGRSRPQFLDSRTERKGTRRRLRVDGRHALPVSAEQRARVEEFMRNVAAGQDDPAFYRLLDCARRIAGTGSLGVDRYVILVEGKGSPDGNDLLDLKQALPSALTPYLSVAQPRWQTQAERVVAVQRRMQAISMAFLQPVRLGKTAYVLRGLQPSEDRVDLACNAGKLRRLSGVMNTMGQVLAWAQLRSAGRDGAAITDELMDFALRKSWKGRLFDVADHCAAQVQKDWLAYARAYDDGAFAL